METTTPTTTDTKPNPNADVLAALGAMQNKSDEHEKICEAHIKEVKTILDEMARKVEDLYKWHDQHDDDGAFKWYLKGSTEDALKAHTAAALAMTTVIAELATAVGKLHKGE